MKRGATEAFILLGGSGRGGINSIMSFADFVFRPVRFPKTYGMYTSYKWMLRQSGITSIIL